MAEERVVVVALDGSHHSDYAFDWYVENSRKENDYVIIATVFDRHGHGLHGIGSADAAQISNQLEKEIDSHKTQIEEFNEKLRKAGVKGEVIGSGGKPGEAVVHVARDKNASMIICGSRGHGMIRRTIMGSISSYIVHHAHIPVIVCRQKSHHNPAHEHHNKHHK